MTQVLVTDAPDKQVAVKITQEIIDSAVMANSSHCVLAEGIKAAWPGATRVSCDMHTCRVTDKASGFRYIFITPRQAASALINWDAGIAPKPFAMRLKAAQVVKIRSETNRVYEPRRVVQVDNPSPADTPVRIFGGRTPPQLKRDRVFGVRQFMGGVALDKDKGVNNPYPSRTPV